MKLEIAHPYALAAIVGGVLLYFLWQRSQNQAQTAAGLAALGPSGPFVAPGGTSATSSSSSAVADGTIPNIVVTPSNLSSSS